MTNRTLEFEKLKDLGPLPSAREERASPGMTTKNEKTRGFEPRAQFEM